jgi:hypothetical protein
VKEEENVYLAGRLKGSGNCMIKSGGWWKGILSTVERNIVDNIDGLSWPFKQAFEST